MMFRELEMPLEQIRRLLDMPDSDMQQALSLQRDLLAMRREHITRLLAQTETIMQKGLTHMDFSAFDKRRMEDYARQAEAAWGNTEAWQDYARREKTRQKGDSAAYGRELMDMLGRFGHSRPASPDAPEGMLIEFEDPAEEDAQDPEAALAAPDDPSATADGASFVTISGLKDSTMYLPL